MRTFRETFPNKHTFLAVVHVEDTQQALRNAEIAKQGGADGIFLINHSMRFSELLAVHQVVAETFPDYWIGLNCLDLGNAAVDVIPEDTHGLWVDHAGVKEGFMPTAEAQQYKERRQRSRWRGIYFGGVAFKYQREIFDVAEAARLALPLVDVITTSGEGTGKAADVDKIRLMKEAVGNHPLAIASGIAPENVSLYMPHADCFLVATGVSDSHTELNLERVQALAEAIQQ